MELIENDYHLFDRLQYVEQRSFLFWEFLFSQTLPLPLTAKQLVICYFILT